MELAIEASPRLRRPSGYVRLADGQRFGPRPQRCLGAPSGDSHSGHPSSPAGGLDNRRTVGDRVGQTAAEGIAGSGGVNGVDRDGLDSVDGLGFDHQRTFRAKCDNNGIGRKSSSLIDDHIDRVSGVNTEKGGQLSLIRNNDR